MKLPDQNLRKWEGDNPNLQPWMKRDIIKPGIRKTTNNNLWEVWLISCLEIVPVRLKLRWLDEPRSRRRSSSLREKMNGDSQVVESSCSISNGGGEHEMAHKDGKVQAARSLVDEKEDKEGGVEWWWLVQVPRGWRESRGQRRIVGCWLDWNATLRAGKEIRIIIFKIFRYVIFFFKKKKLTLAGQFRFNKLSFYSTRSLKQCVAGWLTQPTKDDHVSNKVCITCISDYG